MLPPDALNRNAHAALDLLLTRRSGSAKAMTGPGPSPVEIETILRAATRVPDHGKLAPWRFILFEGKAREDFGEVLAAAKARAEPGIAADLLELEHKRFLRAPLVIGVISRVRKDVPIPEWEQVLSTGAVCQTILLAATALGYVANLITEWCAYDPNVRVALDLGEGERVAGFIYVGKSAKALEDRPRPDLNLLVRRFASSGSANS